jgi:1-acyl-sn-glycerol-3-phosphate acyltransferase
MSVGSLDRKGNPPMKYNHARLEGKRNFLRFLIRVIGFNLLVKLDKVEGLEYIPKEGPAILMINHIAFIDPILVLHACPRNIIPLAKVEALNYPIVGIFPRIWEVIPVRREEVDRRAIQKALEVLKAGEIVLVAPEGTRCPSLRIGKEGIAYLATRSGAPVIPTAVTQTSGFPTLPFTRRWKGPGAQVRFGRPFRFVSNEERPGKEKMRKMTDEAMFALASLLPFPLRGVYADLDSSSQEYIEWL